MYPSISEGSTKRRYSKALWMVVKDNGILVIFLPFYFYALYFFTIGRYYFKVKLNDED